MKRKINILCAFDIYLLNSNRELKPALCKNDLKTVLAHQRALYFEMKVLFSLAISFSPLNLVDLEIALPEVDKVGKREWRGRVLRSFAKSVIIRCFGLCINDLRIVLEAPGKP